MICTSTLLLQTLFMATTKEEQYDAKEEEDETGIQEEPTQTFFAVSNTKNDDYVVQ